jgi:hypothetical protein
LLKIPVPPRGYLEKVKSGQIEKATSFIFDSNEVKAVIEPGIQAFLVFTGNNFY